MLYESFLKSSTRSKFMPKKQTHAVLNVCFDSVWYVSNHIQARNVSKIQNKIGWYSHNLYLISNASNIVKFPFALSFEFLVG